MSTRKWLPAREGHETRALRDKLSESDMNALRSRFHTEVPHLNGDFIPASCGKLRDKVIRYNIERNRACCAEDIDKLAHIRHEIEQEAVAANLTEEN